MESPNRQAVKLLREQRRRRKRVAAFLCLAGFVAVGTMMALRMSGRAMNNEKLDCVLSHNLPHQHSEECYYTPPGDGAQKLLVCGTADFVVHKHDPERCYDKSGNLVCMLPEIEEHTHTDECYQTQQVLSCGLQEGDGGHVHSDSCYSPDLSAEPVCGIEESVGHTHGEGCFDEQGQLTCELEEGEGHTHDDSCFPKTISCGLEEGSGGHIHSDACYSTEAILTCGKNEVHLHTHTEECYLHTVDQLDQNQDQLLADRGFDISQMAIMEISDQAPGEENRVLASNGEPVLKCGETEVLEHVHDDSCFTAVGPEGELLSQLGSGSEDSGMPGQRSAVYQDATLRATAVYDGEDFPEGARMNVERVDESEGLRAKQQQLDGTVDGMQLQALLKVTVSGSDQELSEPIRLSIEPAGQAEVSAAAWYNADGFEEQGVYVQNTVLEFELLNVAKQENGSYETKIAPGAVVGIASRPAAEESRQDEQSSSGYETAEPGNGQSGEEPVLNISQAFEYEDEDYMMVFHIDGVARVKPGADTDVSAEDADLRETEADPEQETGPVQTSEPEAFEDADQDGEGDTGDASALNEDNGEDGGEPGDNQAFDTVPTPVPTQEPRAESESQPLMGNAPVEKTVTIAGDVLRANVLDDPENPLGLKVERLAEDSPEYGVYADNVKIDNTENDLPDMKVMSYALYYKSMELDIAQCTVTLEVKASPSLLRAAAKIVDSQGAESGDQEAPVAIAVMTAGSVVQEDELETGEKVFTTQEGGQQSAAPVADPQAQADELIGSCIDSSLDCSYSAAPLNEHSDSVALTLQGSAADNSFVTISDANVPLAENSLYFSAGVEDEATGEESAEGEADEDEAAADETIAGDNETEDGDFGSAVPQNRIGSVGDINNLRTITFNDGENTFVVVATTAHNPKFNVEYYAVLDKVKEYTKSQINGLPSNISDENERDREIKRLGYLPVIDTRDVRNEEDGSVTQERGLPQNGVTPQVTYLKVNSNTVETEKRLTEIYDTMGDQTYFKRPSLPYFMPGDDVEESYDLKQIWVTREDGQTERYGKVTVTDKDGTYTPTDNSTAAADIAFTNREDLNGKPGYIYVSDNCTIRLVFEPKTISETTNVPTNFYDYDITDGKDKNDKYWVNEAWGHGKGINSDDNYEKGEDGKIVGTQYAFGNGDSSIITGLGDLRWNGNELNKANTNGKGYQNCTFGLAIKADGNTVTFANGVNAPDLFGEEVAKGKICYGREKGKNELGFTQYGDTYTLDFAKVDGNSIGNLSLLGNVQNYKHVWTNNFWPMDAVSNNAKDPKYGNNQPQYWCYNGSGGTENRTFNKSDDGEDRNSFFGMNFSVEFTLTDGYTGPLEYLFFGDDDMWVFLDGQLVCDIGGVHSSVGEIVNLWDYVERPAEGEEKTHRLDFFYTERGAYGSTCWMQYTLPSVQEVGQALTSGKYGSLTFEKLVNNQIMDGGLSGTDGKPGQDNTQETFLFSIKLTDDAGKPLSSGFKYLKYDAEGKLQSIPIYKDDGTIDTSQDNGLIPGGGSEGEGEGEEGDGKGPALFNGAYFTLKKGEKIEVPSLPRGTKYIIAEEGVLMEGVQPAYNRDTKQWEYTTKAKANQEHQYDYFVNGEKQATNVCEGVIPTDENANVEIEFANTYYSFELPKTGGPGAHVFTAAGAIMLLCAGCLPVRRRKK